MKILPGFIIYFAAGALVAVVLGAGFGHAAAPAGTSTVAVNSAYKEYTRYLEEVLKVMREHYYFDISQADYDRFIKVFDEKIFPSLLLENKSSDYVRWRSAAYLVDFLKQPDDLFSRFWPPKPAEKFVREVYGQKIDLGITGHREGSGYVVDVVEPRSDAALQGLKAGDMLIALGESGIGDLSDQQVQDRLNPLVGTKVALVFVRAESLKPYRIEVESREYFKQTVFLQPTGVPDVYCLKIEKFNQGTPEDMERLVQLIAPRHPRGLVLDLRGNPGGPPLAARAISGFFLPNGQALVYFEGKNRPRADLDIPVFPESLRFDWPITILVDQGTGSASELFSGVMQARRRAVVMGQRTAGQVLLKSLFDLSDGSTLAMVVARGHFPDGRAFPFDGVMPDEEMGLEYKDSMVALAAKYLYLKSAGKL